MAGPVISVTYCAALVAALCFGRLVVGHFALLVLVRQLLLQRPVSARVDIDQWDMMQPTAVFMDLWCSIGAVHQIIRLRFALPVLQMKRII